LRKRQDSLATRLRAGDHEAAAELVDSYYRQVYLFMRRLGHSCQVSEDLTQETFLQAWQHVGQLRSGRALNSWLYRIAGNVSITCWRRHKVSVSAGIDGLEPLGGSGVEPDELERAEQLGRLRDAVVKLPVKLRQVVVLHYMQHLTIAEASVAAGVRQGTFKSRLNRALEILRKQVIEQ
jgi:RNA polymerase sigma-70 factor (ECF subfamily)